ncbi:ImmA/IrrE family metallo-endopeptidase [Stenotrophomonas sp. FR012]|uniref:ImmA/IrrE family metallo-endopeptidase n=1 Tax=Stenotrophomonas sp. FR012 TaxID=3398457 RepID=UPI0039C5D66F
MTASPISAANYLLSLAEENGVPRSAPIDIDAIVRGLGIRVFRIDEDTDLVGQITKTRDSVQILINERNNLYRPRLRFTLAHEIGHLFLHLSEDGEFRDTPRTMSRTSSYWDRQEAEANSFAAELLMPSDLLIHEIENFESAYRAHYGFDLSTGALVEEMSRRFEVSNAAMEYRLSNLGLLK